MEIKGDLKIKQFKVSYFQKEASLYPANKYKKMETVTFRVKIVKKSCCKWNWKNLANHIVKLHNLSKKSKGKSLFQMVT